MSTLLTQDVVDAIALKTGGTKKDAKAHLDAFKEVVTEAVKAKGTVAIKGLVTFETKAVAQRSAKNPKTGAPVTVAAHTKASAKLAPSLRKF